MVANAFHMTSSVTSLGDNAEFDHYRSACGFGTDSLFRWSYGSIDVLFRLLPLVDSGEGYAFEDLVPVAPGMLEDLGTGLRLHTGMRSRQLEGVWRFIHSPEDRRARYEVERRRFVMNLESLRQALVNQSEQTFVIKSNNGLDIEQVRKLDRLLCELRGVHSHTLISVVPQGLSAVGGEWISERCYHATVPSLAPYTDASSVNHDHWREIFLQIDGEKYAQLLSPGKGETGQDFCWEPRDSEKHKQLVLQGMVRKLTDTSQIVEWLQHVVKVDAQHHEYTGGLILDMLRQGTPPRDWPDTMSEDFDNRYMRLLVLFSIFDLEEAEALHRTAKEAYSLLGRSIVRYHRLGGSINNARGFLDEFLGRGALVHDVHPEPDSRLRKVLVKQGETFISADLASALNDGAIRLDVTLNTPYERKPVRVSDVDDTDLVANQWVDKLRVSRIDKAEFHVLPDARVSCSPSAIVYKSGGMYRTVASTLDIYHHSCIAGKVGLKNVSRDFEEAYVLPRFGPRNNYYHSLIDKLPGLYGYKLLELNCPIISGYYLNDVERHFIARMGLDPDAIIYDSSASFAIKRAIVGVSPLLRNQFYRFCAQWPQQASPHGKKIYISRGDASGRGMTNESQVEKLLAAQGFDIVSMESHDLDTQIAISANARCMVAPHGAGMSNMIFSRPGLQVIELIPERYMVRFFQQLALDCGHGYSVVQGKMLPTEPGKVDAPGEKLHWEVDLNTLEKVLNSLSGNQRAA